jgi:PAS domain S-box-containing protein
VSRALAAGYATQVKAFLTLLVLFLAVAVYGDRRLVGAAREAVLDETGERLGVEADLTRAELERDQMMRGLDGAGGGTPYIPPSYLERMARLRGLERIEVLGLDGRVVSSSESSRIGTADSALADPADRRRLMLLSGRTVMTPLDAPEAAGRATLGAYRPIRDRSRATVGFIRVDRQVAALGAVDQTLRALATLQSAGLAVVALLVVLFARWLLRPFRSLQRAAVEAAAAGAAPAPGSTAHGDEAEALVQAFQGVLEKLRGQEAELSGLKSRAAGSAPGAADRLLSGMASAALVFDRDGRLLSLNAAATVLLGLPRSASIGRAAADLLGGSPRLVELLDGALDEGEGRSREVVTLKRPDGRACHLGAMLSPIRDAEAAEGARRADGVVCLLTDLTEIRALRERARYKESLAALGEMSAGIAHEFRNALAVVLGHARLVDRAAGTDGVVGNHAQAILREVRRLQEVVNDFLRFARQESPEFHPVEVAPMLAELAGDFRADPRNAGIVLVVEGEAPHLVADEANLRQALVNLLRNAAEALPPGGAGERRVVLRASVTGGGEQVRFEVEDNGPGIEPDRLPRLFAPFYTTKEGGTGLGLALVRKVAAMHDGQAEAGNIPGGGARVVIILPASPGAAPSLDLVA